MPSSRQQHERLPKFLALPVFSSDAVSSVAYGPEEVLIALAVVGGVVWTLSLPIGIAIVALIAIVSISYRQTIFAYPHGGGSYTVAKENLGALPGLVAAGSLLTDYVLTVAVSIAAGIEALIAKWPAIGTHRVEYCLVAVLLVAFANMRGLRESGALFALPTYGFIIGLFGLVIFGLQNVLLGGPVKTIVPTSYHLPVIDALSALVVLRAFSSGCSALTGIEAIANGIPAFKAPETKNAAATLVIMAIILGTLVLGIAFLGHIYHALPGAFLQEHKLTSIPNYEVLKDQTLVAQLADHLFGRHGFYLFIQVFTAGILILAANTAFQDFPRLSSILARDRYAPRQLASIGDRLVFSNGILFLSITAALLLIVFKGKTTLLIPLYAVGVFVSFTLSQFGMGVRQRRLKQHGWKLQLAISLLGGTVTGIVALVIAVTKFASGPKFMLWSIPVPTGAYIVLILIPTLVLIFYKIHQHYIELGDQLRLADEDLETPIEIKSTAIVLVAGIHRGITPALKYASTLSHDCRALYIEIDHTETPLVRERWERFGMGVPLVILESPYRSVVGPVMNYLEEVKKERPGWTVTVVLPEFVPKKWWHKVLHNQSGLFLKVALMFRKDIVITNVRYYLEK
ncbi:MAG: APC family permease [Armatimonadetes bacterium]|nr:APC family permease [Armatimonadota bacterium]